tara:strand:+ start:749 stop:1015 length:267 start_codon:yes stop_codon:yes gene_type:complete
MMDNEMLMQLLIMQNPQLAPILEMMNKTTSAADKPKKRKVSAYSRRYGAAYKRLRKRHTLKNGKYRKGYNHKRLVKLAHKEAKRGGKK